MFSTFVVAALFIQLLIAFFVVWAISLRLGLRWVKVEGVTNRKIVLATAAFLVVRIAIVVLGGIYEPSSKEKASLLEVPKLVADTLATCFIISLVFKTRFRQSLQAWLATLLPSVLALLFISVMLKPIVVEAFVMPTNSMAPTLLGNHWQGVCNTCGRPKFCTPPYKESDSLEPEQMICENFHTSDGVDLDKQVHPPDRFLVAKFLMPRRWDIVTFRFPANPSVVYAKRLVGLPGEVIHIADGAVWANGKKLAPPESLKGIKYLSDMPPLSQEEIWGTEKRPATLGKDEYFVLGDFSAHSMDSRLWGDGAPGHPSYAVPESHLIGVVTQIYWPPSRWRILR